MTGTTTMIRDSLRVPLFTDIVSIDVDDDATQTHLPETTSGAVSSRRSIRCR